MQIIMSGISGGCGLLSWVLCYTYRDNHQKPTVFVVVKVIVNVKIKLNIETSRESAGDNCVNELKSELFVDHCMSRFVFQFIK